MSFVVEDEDGEDAAEEEEEEIVPTGPAAGEEDEVTVWAVRTHLLIFLVPPLPTMCFV